MTKFNQATDSQPAIYMSEAAPAFSFYAKDFMLGTVTMSLAARGAYITLLAYQWDHGSVPADPGELARICGCSLRQMAQVVTAVLTKFQQGADGAFRNARLEMERAKQAEYRSVQRRKGQAGARVRWKPADSTGHAPAMPRASPGQWPNDGFPSASSFPVSVSDPVSTTTDTARHRGQPPLAMGLKRLKFWRWMADDFIRKLGTHASDFDLDAWIHECDDTETRVISGDWWGYWLPAFEAEVRRRGLPLAMDTTPKAGKQTTKLATALANIAREEGST